MSHGPPEPAAVRAWLRASVAAARRAARELPGSTVSVGAAGIRVDVHLVGARLAAELAPALLRAPESAAPAVAACWGLDGSAPSAPPLPRPPWGPADYLPGDELRGSREGRLLAGANVAHPTFNAVDLDAGTGLQWLRDGPAPWDAGVPLRDVLRWTFGAHGLHLVHGAAVGTDEGGVLLCGAGGAGKSTASLACLRGGLRFVSDDYSLIAEDGVAHPLFAIAKADAATLRLLPGLEARATTTRRDWRGKAHLRVSEIEREGLPLRALVFPERAGSTGVPSPLPARAALERLLPSTLIQLPAAHAGTVRVLARLARELPAFTLPVGPDVDRIPEAVRRLLAERVAVAA